MALQPLRGLPSWRKGAVDERAGETERKGEKRRGNCGDMEREVDRKIKRNQPEEQLICCWELLVVCYTETRDCRVSLAFFCRLCGSHSPLIKDCPRCLPTMCPFPFVSSGFEVQTDANSVEDIFGAHARAVNGHHQLSKLHWASDLLLPPDDVFLRLP